LGGEKRGGKKGGISTATKKLPSGLLGNFGAETVQNKKKAPEREPTGVSKRRTRRGVKKVAQNQKKKNPGECDLHLRKGEKKRRSKTASKFAVNPRNRRTKKGIRGKRKEKKKDHQGRGAARRKCSPIKVQWTPGGFEKITEGKSVAKHLPVGSLEKRIKSRVKQKRLLMGGVVSERIMTFLKEKKRKGGGNSQIYFPIGATKRFKRDDWSPLEGE